MSSQLERNCIFRQFFRSILRRVNNCLIQINQQHEFSIVVQSLDLFVSCPLRLAFRNTQFGETVHGLHVRVHRQVRKSLFRSKAVSRVCLCVQFAQVATARCTHVLHHHFVRARLSKGSEQHFKDDLYFNFLNS